ncbi:MAG TPA: cyclodeaminase/cyclohydrolase family protein [Bacillota bacterium]|nr:cyclodeaminase/cyclohydrolase family protein [Fastidiosipila sp.]HPX92957.1 cyclodeaminase/cyclohydrolase family protein [Bacillota bacterium]HQB80771.1 cyclodeaminase/cyclohydrolase family protein [Bacillota bacterium]
MEFKHLKITEYLERAASSSATPGGGSVSALIAALGSALGQMVYNLTVTKKSYQANDETTKAAVQSDWRAIESLQRDFTDLIDRDIEAFNVFMDALALPKETDQDKAKRKQALADASITAMEVPLTTAGKSLELLKHLGSIARYGHKTCISDAGVAALCAHAALQASVMNVRINLAGIDDPEIRQGAEKSSAAYLEESALLTKEIIDIVYAQI